MKLHPDRFKVRRYDTWYIMASSLVPGILAHEGAVDYLKTFTMPFRLKQGATRNERKKNSIPNAISISKESWMLKIIDHDRMDLPHHMMLAGIEGSVWKNGFLKNG